MLRNITVCVNMLDIFFGKYLRMITALIFSNSNICVFTIIFYGQTLGRNRVGAADVWLILAVFKLRGREHACKSELAYSSSGLTQRHISKPPHICRIHIRDTFLLPAEENRLHPPPHPPGVPGVLSNGKNLVPLTQIRNLLIQVICFLRYL